MQLQAYGIPLGLYYFLKVKVNPYLTIMSVDDPEVRAPTLKPIILQMFCPKLHENEQKNWLGYAHPSCLCTRRYMYSSFSRKNGIYIYVNFGYNS